MTEALHAPQPSELVEHFLAEAISNSPQPLKDLAEFLSNALGEDDWKIADRLLLALSLRNRTSEPEAGAVAWRARMRPDGEWMVLDAKYVPSRAADSAVEVQPLFDHPAAPSADKLREVCQDVINQMADNIEKLALTPAKRELVKAAFRACIGRISTPDALKGDAK